MASTTATTETQWYRYIICYISNLGFGGMIFTGALISLGRLFQTRTEPCLPPFPINNVSWIARIYFPPLTNSLTCIVCISFTSCVSITLISPLLRTKNQLLNMIRPLSFLLASKSWRGTLAFPSRPHFDVNPLKQSMIFGRWLDGGKRFFWLIIWLYMTLYDSFWEWLSRTCNF